MEFVKGIEICNEEYRGDTPVLGVLFDMDGIVLDTERLYTRFWKEAAQSLGYPMTHEMALGMRSLNHREGERRLKEFLGEEADYDKVRNKRIEIMSAFIEENGVEAKPGMDALLDYLEQKGIQKAIATSSPMDRTEKYLSQVGLWDRFDEIISAQMVETGKPAPDIYIYAAQKLGLSPKECLVLEDSPTGILAAKRAGCIPVMVPDQDGPDAQVRQMIYAAVENLETVIELLERKGK